MITCSGDNPAAFGDLCQYTCNSGYTGDTTVSCGDSNGDGIGDFGNPTCTGTLLPRL